MFKGEPEGLYIRSAFPHINNPHHALLIEFQRLSKRSRGFIRDLSRLLFYTFDLAFDLSKSNPTMAFNQFGHTFKFAGFTI